MAGTICPNSLQIEAEVLAVPASRLDETGEAELYAMRIKETYEMLLAGLDVLERAVEKYRQTGATHSRLLDSRKVGWDWVSSYALLAERASHANWRSLWHDYRTSFDRN